MRPARPPRSILFACNLNSIRSPMAAALAAKMLGRGVWVESCGLFEGGYLDPFMVEVMGERGIDLSGHAPKTFEDMADSNFDLIVALTLSSHERALALARTSATQVEFWPLPDPTEEYGGRESRLAAYRLVRDTLEARLKERFAPQSTAGG